MRHPLAAAALAAAVALAACSSSRSPDRKLRVAAASDLARAFAEIAAEFRTRTGVQPEIEFGSSGLLAKQIEQGAPFSVFAAANRGYIDQVVKAGRCDAATARLYARGRLVVWTPAGVARPSELAELADPRFRKIAIANPEHAPYGRAARQALEAAGVWPRIADRIVLGENIQATLLYARNGNADAALVALALTVASDSGAALPIDPALHAPIDQAMVVCGQGDDQMTEAAKQFVEFVGSREGREVMTRYGFQQPTDDAPPHAKTP